MPSTLTTISDRVEQTLADTSNVIWVTAAITEGVRSALGEYNTAGRVEDAGATACTLNLLDSATVTTLPEVHDTVIVLGAAAYCALSRAIDRADSYQLGADMVHLKDWGDQRMKEFRAMLGAIFPAYMGVAAATGGGTTPGGGTPATSAAEAARLADLRSATNASWGTWEDDDVTRFNAEKDED